MPEANTTRRPDRPAGFTTARLPAHPDRPVRLFLPDDYQPKYAYPLVVMLHGDGADEDAAARLAPRLSRRNYIAACPRGPVALGPSPTGRPAFAWDAGDARLARYVLGVLNHARREYNVHAGRVYLLGVGEGASVAYRVGLTLRDRVAGVVALNGSPGTCRVQAARGLRVFVGHGASNPLVPVAAARKAARTLAAAGADVRFQAYPTTHHVHGDMLRDVNRWLIERVNSDPDTDPVRNPNG
jgi:phospholipase/carboxylesterase